MMKHVRMYMVVVALLLMGAAGCPKSQTPAPAGRPADGNTATQRSREGTNGMRNRERTSQPNAPGAAGRQGQSGTTPGGGAP
jgi:hypothetical protein